MSFSATTDEPDLDQLTRMKKVMSHANQFGQTLEEVLRLFEFDVNTIDDAFLYLVKEYVADEKNKVSSKVVEIRRMNPALIEFDLDEMGLPNNTHFICYFVDRTTPSSAAEPTLEKSIDTVRKTFEEKLRSLKEDFHRNLNEIATVKVVGSSSASKLPDAADMDIDQSP